MLRRFRCQHQAQDPVAAPESMIAPFYGAPRSCSTPAPGAELEQNSLPGPTGPRREAVHPALEAVAETRSAGHSIPTDGRRPLTTVSSRPAGGVNHAPGAGQRRTSPEMGFCTSSQWKTPPVPDRPRAVGRTVVVMQSSFVPFSMDEGAEHFGRIRVIFPRAGLILPGEGRTYCAFRVLIRFDMPGNQDAPL